MKSGFLKGKGKLSILLTFIFSIIVVVFIIYFGVLLSLFGFLIILITMIFIKKGRLRKGN